MTPVTNRQVLVLNFAYEPMNIVTARRAMTLVAKGAAIVLEASKRNFIRTSKVNFPLPSVIRLLHYRHIPRFNRTVSRRAIFMRDGFKCQYCLATGGNSTLTLDHVTPRSRGGRNSWENMTTCCFPCNNKKGNRTPEEAGMPLHSRPLPFGLHAKHRQAASMSGEAEAWGKYLFY